MDTSDLFEFRSATTQYKLSHFQSEEETEKVEEKPVAAVVTQEKTVETKGVQTVIQTVTEGSGRWISEKEFT